ncbi:MAG TPA: hypothetical protein VFI77_03985 [Gemmatimonadales bacterium]|nr:hypothetical protein [Gemmatimonadales bacterium]
MSADQPIQLHLTPEQQELIRRLTGEHANVLELALGQGDGSSGTGHGINFNWRISVDSGIPRQQWTFGLPKRPAPDPGSST